MKPLRPVWLSDFSSLKKGRFFRSLVGLVLLAFPLVLAWLLYHRTPDELVLPLYQLGWWRLAVLFAFNAAIVALLVGRWQLILRTQGHPVPLSSLIGCRLAGFGLNYFVPGPPVGGEPLQIYLLHRGWKIPAADVVASVTLDRLIDVISNLGAICLGLVWLLGRGRNPGVSLLQGLPLVLLLLVMPIVYLWALCAGHAPFSWLLDRVPLCRGRWKRVGALCNLLQHSEQQSVCFCRDYPRIVFWAMVISVIGWGGLIVEYRVSLAYLGIQPNLANTYGALILSRLIFVLPLSPSMGTLEFGQLLAMDLLGAGPLAGLVLSLWMRVRDSFLAAGGLVWGEVVLRRAIH